jgi:Cytochrome b5-like Heme/Steroid binding domain
MAPDADQLRRRVPCSQQGQQEVLEPARESSLHPAASSVVPPLLSSLRPNEVAIDGIVYDLDSFKDIHPGGRVVMMFGGTDATVAYRMIHPHHPTGNVLLATKLQSLATIPNYEAE